MLTLISAAQNGIAIRQPEPKEGRKAFPISGSGGYVGTNPGQLIAFLTGGESFQWNTQALGQGAPSGIMSLWVDASNVASGKFLYLNINNGLQWIAVAGGTQGYFVITAQMPFNMVVTTNNGAAVQVGIIAYNYNVLFTGSVATAPISGSGGGSGSGGASGGGGVGGLESGGYGGGGGNRPNMN